MAKILIPTPLRQYAGGSDVVEVEAATVGEALDKLTTEHADLKRHLFNDEGKLRSFVNVYVDDDDIRYLDKEKTAVTGEGVISIVPSIAGGGASPLTAAPVTAEPAAVLTNEEIQRYSRHLIMPEVGMEGQLKLKQAKVLMIGTGGLGAPLGLYLAAAGVGRIGIVDFDTVDVTNLQRQVIHGTKDIGRPKLDSAAERMADINPHVEIVKYETTLSSENALDIIKDYDVVVDGTDNFPTRYLVNDACVLLDKPNVYGSIFRFEGQATVFHQGDGPCYRCLYPEPPPPGLVPSCAEGGVLGILPALVGSMQATETVKLIIGKGETLSGRLVLYDALTMAVADAQTRELLELPAVLERVAQLASFSTARTGVRGLRPDADRVAVRARLELTTQGRQFLEVSPSFTVGGARDVRAQAERAARGARLDPADLLDVHDHLRATRLAVAAVGGQAAEVPALWSLVEGVSDPLDLEGRIAAAIDEQAEVRDKASPELARLRRVLAQERGRLTRLLERLVQQVSSDILRERLVTERRGRLTVPVRRERQRDFPGVVHDVSASGATVFMEPLAVIEAGNEIRALEVAERREVERILLELSAAVGAERRALNAAVQALADLDRTLAVARYAMALDATSPEVSDDTAFDLRAARHPLLEHPVPIDVHLDGAEARALVITGANTGGKTVALKTVGLLHLMAACGLHVPAQAGSRVAVFERVVADIGDAQSIEHSLSTFASHVGNLLAMVEAAGPGALALADEIGAGTDPDEGAALGQAVIAALLERGATVVATTHHPALKAFAAGHPRTRNASVEFDLATLRPTYRLRLGIPGSSNALEIAERLGLDTAIVADARTRMSARALDLEQAIADAQAKLAAAERERSASAGRA